MNTRRFFNNPNSKEKELKRLHIRRIEDRCGELAAQERKEIRESQQSHDEVCPRCAAGKRDIVDQIVQVVGSGEVIGGLFRTYGSMSMDTNTVNHCNKCNHEWKKFESRTVTSTDILRVTLRYLTQLVKNPTKQKELNWKLEAIKVFNDCSAEAIRAMYLKHSSYLSYDGALGLRTLRKRFPSIFDDNNKKRLKEI